jgi:hypothetical protein
MTSEKLTEMHARWASILQEYDVDIQHRSGVTHGDADGLLRNPLPSEEDRTGARMHHNSPVTSVTAGLALLACVGTEAIKTAADQPALAVLRRMETRRQPRTVPLTPHLICLAGRSDSSVLENRQSRPGADRCCQGPSPTPS